MLTIFTCPKPFRRLVGVNQSNAVRSWCRLVPKPQVILAGDEDGTAEMAAETGALHVRDVAVNEYGTPLVSSVFSVAEKHAEGRFLAFVNSDIILLQDFMNAVTSLRSLKAFLCTGQRYDLDVAESLGFDRDDWIDQLSERVRSEGSLHFVTGMDYFLFPYGTMRAIPDFAIGRSGWDNWMVWDARCRGVPVIDATGTVTAIHQNHDYSHIAEGNGKDRKGPETERNLGLMQGCNMDIRECSHVLKGGRIRPARDGMRVDRRVEWMRKTRPGLFKMLLSWKVRYALCFCFPNASVEWEKARVR